LTRPPLDNTLGNRSDLNYNEAAIRLPKLEHDAVSAAQTARGAVASARDLLASEIRFLRGLTSAPRSRLFELITLSKDLHLTDYMSLHRMQR
jgi:hypothetical protein